MIGHLLVDGLRIAYERAGEGPPLVLVHGGLCDGRVWRWQLEDMASDFTVVAWDAPGCGRSADPPDSFRLPEYTDCLGSLIGGLGLGRPIVVGHSFGGGLALELFRRHRAVVGSLVLAGAYAGWAGSLPPEEVERRLALAFRLADGAHEPVPGFLSDGLPPEAAEHLRMVMADVRPEATRGMARAFAEADLRDVLPEIDVPTLLVYGDADERAPAPVAEDLHARIPGSRLVYLAGLGHECYLEAPERFNAEVRAFVAGQSRLKGSA